MPKILKNNILASNSIYVCTEHNSNQLDKYYYFLDPIFKKISDFEEGDDINSYLDSEVCHSGFSRLN